VSASLKRMYNGSASNAEFCFVRNGTEYSVRAPSDRIASAVPYLQTDVPLRDLQKITGAPEHALIAMRQQLEAEGLSGALPSDELSGPQFYAIVRERLADWLAEAFSGKYWDVMRSGAGSRGLYIGYLSELYHYTRNASRHMPLAVACCPSELKRVKRLLVTHYLEEWNHFGFFASALSAMGIPARAVAASEPLPSTLEMSNFMRQAARESPLCYSICSAILEGTTEDGDSYTRFFKDVAQHYGIPDGAVRPIFEHLALDEEYQHKSLFAEICDEFASIPAAEANRVLSFAQQMVDHIFLWGEHILRYYSARWHGELRREFDVAVD
jgi:pyrroloquinoline quinone (PQQ) biosynthesis protein C